MMKRFVCLGIVLMLIALCATALAAGDGKTDYRAVLVGIDGYQTNALSGCVTDASCMAALLQTANEAGAFYQPPITRSNLQASELSALFTETDGWDADDDDVTFFYFAGHGYMTDKGNPAIVGKDSKIMRVADLRDKLDAIPGVKVVVFDCRYADSLLKTDSAQGSLVAFNAAVLDTFEQGANASNYYVLSASTLASSEAKALATGDSARGVVTYYFAQGCGFDYAEQRPTGDMPADLGDNGAVSLSEIVDYITGQIEALPGADEIVFDLRASPESSAYPVFAKRATAEVLDVHFDADETLIPAGRTQQLTVRTTPANASMRSVVWTSSDLSIAEVDADGVVTGVKPGVVTIAATTANGLTVTKEVTIRDVRFVDSITLNYASLVLGPDSTIQLVPTVEPSFANESLTWSTSSPAVAEVDQEGNVTCHTAGDAYISVTSENGVEASCAIRIAAKDAVVTALQIPKNNISLFQGESREIKYQIKPNKASDGSIHLRSENEEIVATSGDNTVTGVAPGECVVYATASSGITKEIHVSVKGATLTLSKTAANIKKGKKITIKTKIMPKNLEEVVVWESSDPAVATVENGRVTGVEPGEATITATIYDTITATCQVMVDGKPVKKVSLKPAQLRMKVDEVQEIKATLNPATATVTTLAWKSSNEQVAIVDDTGSVTAVGAGRAVITATAHNKKKARTLVIVKGVTATSLTLSESTLSLVAGMEGENKATLTAETMPVSANNVAVKWTSSNHRVATVDGTGAVTAKAPGKCVIKAKSGKKSATCNVTVARNESVYKKPTDAAAGEVSVSAQHIGYKGGVLHVGLYATNKTSAAITLPPEGVLTLTLADGQVYEIPEAKLKAGKNAKKKLPAGKRCTLAYTLKVAQGDPLYGLDLRGATATIGAPGAADDAGFENVPIDDTDMALDDTALDDEALGDEYPGDDFGDAGAEGAWGNPDTETV